MYLIAAANDPIHSRNICTAITLIRPIRMTRYYLLMTLGSLSIFSHSAIPRRAFMRKFVSLVAGTPLVFTLIHRSINRRLASAFGGRLESPQKEDALGKVDTLAVVFLDKHGLLCRRHFSAFADSYTVRQAVLPLTASFGRSIIPISILTDDSFLRQRPSKQHRPRDRKWQIENIIITILRTVFDFSSGSNLFKWSFCMEAAR